MNIKQAKEQIKNAVTAYFTKDEFGSPVIPVERQRPVFLLGPPGIGKTAVMEQIAAELGVGLVSYSMTHHTRQSALGLPFIVQKTYGTEEYSVSEYTMSEIIASVYDMIETTGKREGILFLDEINCVSETLAPVMLQFLQYKVFGRHRVPEGWIVVAAGNPLEYNNSVREFDIVTWDRLKRIEVEPDYHAWKEYAYKAGVHAAVVTYLDNKKDDFYLIETTVDGKSFVTARGWSDLSDMIKLYERLGIPVNEELVSQYLQNSSIAKKFSVYYDLFNKYRADYQVDKILSGKAPAEVKSRAGAAKFDERLALLGLLLDGINTELKAVFIADRAMAGLLEALKNIRMDMLRPGASMADSIDRELTRRSEELNIGKKASSLSRDDENVIRSVINILEEEQALIAREAPGPGAEAFKLLKSDFDRRTRGLKKTAAAAGERLTNLFAFCEEVFPDGQERLILVTELSISCYASGFISKYGCKEYFEHNNELLFYERQKEIISELRELELEEL
ncbi:MAG: AAA family ATPase [Oscillospiraceae bacterium]|nr:AAA family ATPase [Oscillospiraceae bacterium]